MDTYQLARAVLRQNPAIGKEKLALATGSVPNSAARNMARFLGETEGHAQDPEYGRVAELKKAGWRDSQVIDEFKKAGIDRDRVQRHLARYVGATQPAPEFPPNFNWREHVRPIDLTVEADELKKRIRNILLTAPKTGQQKLARLAGCRTGRARRLREEMLGELSGHSTEPGYQKILEWIRTQVEPEAKGQITARTLKAALNISKTRASVYLARWRGATAREKAMEANSQPTAQTRANGTTRGNGDGVWTNNVHGDCRQLEYRGTKIRSAEEALKQAAVDQQIWRVTDIREQWRDEPDGYAQIVVKLKQRKEDLNQLEIQNRFLQELEKVGAQRPIVPYKRTGSGLLYLPCIADLHMGKYCWAPETGVQYDLKVARERCEAAMEDLLGKAATFEPEQIVLAVGHDIMNTDNGRTTTNGTEQDETGRWQEAYLATQLLVAWMIERCRTLAPTHIIMIAGNHDRQRLFYLGQHVAALYKHTPGITVDSTPRMRKYYRWGGVGLTFCHGDTGKDLLLPYRMSVEFEEFHKTWYHECLLGHRHTRQREQVMLLDKDLSGTLMRYSAIRYMPSLCPSDAWMDSQHFAARRAAEGYLYHRDRGLIAEFSHIINDATPAPKNGS